MKIEKITKDRYGGGCGGKVYKGVNRSVGRFCREACLLMYASNVDRRCRSRGTIENYTRLHSKVLQNTPLSGGEGNYKLRDSYISDY